MSAPTVNPSMEQPRPSTRSQWWVLTLRFIAPALRNGELITAIGASVGFTVGFYIPFSIPWNHFVGGGSSGVASNLGQYITPLITCRPSRSPPFHRPFGRQPIRCRASIDGSGPCR